MSSQYQKPAPAPDLGPLFSHPEEEFQELAVCPVPREEAVVFGIIFERKGRANAIGMARVAEQAGLSTRVVQQLIHHLIVDHRLRIGSATDKPAGYYWILTEQELSLAVAQLDGRIIETAQRKAALLKSTLPHVLGQLALDLKPKEAA